MVNSNAKNLIRQLLSSGGTVGLLAAKDVGGNVRYIADYDAYPAVVEDTFTLTAANAGISVGSGSTAATENDYQLGTTITSGLTGTVTTEKSVDASGNSSVTFTVTLTNTSGSSINISEIGYKQEIAASDSFKGTSATDRVFLLDRSVFDTITIAAGASAVIDYTIKAVVTNNGGAEGTKSITQNGTYNALDDSLDGYATVTVNVSPNVGSKNISTNGTYNASSDSLDGYSSVTVAVSPNVGTKSITVNGTYNASSDSYDGYSSVTVEVPGSAVLGTKSISQNGTYSAQDDNYDGYSSVTVNVSGGGTTFAFVEFTYNTGTTVTATDGITTLTSDTSGDYIFAIPNSGTWTFTSGSNSVSLLIDTYGSRVNGRFSLLPYSVLTDILAEAVVDDYATGASTWDAFTLGGSVSVATDADRTVLNMPQNAYAKYDLVDSNTPVTAYIVCKEVNGDQYGRIVEIPYDRSDRNCPMFIGMNRSDVFYSTWGGSNEHATGVNPSTEYHVYAITLDKISKVAHYCIDGGTCTTMPYNNSGNSVWYTEEHTFANDSGMDANVLFAALVNGYESDSVMQQNCTFLMNYFNLT
jgi:hypothetical protein